MNQLSLYKLILDLIKTDKPTVEQVQCARTILKSLIEAEEEPQQSQQPASDLDLEAFKAQQELL